MIRADFIEATLDGLELSQEEFLNKINDTQSFEKPSISKVWQPEI